MKAQEGGRGIAVIVYVTSALNCVCVCVCVYIYIYINKLEEIL